MPQMAASGDVVEHQTYLNGTRYYLVEGAGEFAGAEWLWTLALTLPKDEGDEIGEGDLSLTRDGAAWYGAVAGGAHSETTDEATDAPVTVVTLRLRRQPDAESTEPWRTGTATAVIATDTCRLALALD